MYDFLTFFNEKRKTYPMRMEISYTKTTDWSVYIYRKGCGQDGARVDILYVQHCDMELCFAKAHVELKEWLLEHEGGY